MFSQKFTRSVIKGEAIESMHRNMHPGEPMPPLFWLELVDVLEELFSEIHIDLLTVPPRNIEAQDVGKIFFGAPDGNNYATKHNEVKRRYGNDVIPLLWGQISFNLNILFI